MYVQLNLNFKIGNLKTIIVNLKTKLKKEVHKYEENS